MLQGSKYRSKSDCEAKRKRNFYRENFLRLCEAKRSEAGETLQLRIHQIWLPADLKSSDSEISWAGFSPAELLDRRRRSAWRWVALGGAK